MCTVALAVVVSITYAADALIFGGGNDDVHLADGLDRILFDDGDGHIIFGASEKRGISFDDASNDLELFVSSGGNLIVTLGD